LVLLLHVWVHVGHHAAWLLHVIELRLLAGEHGLLLLLSHWVLVVPHVLVDHLLHTTCHLIHHVVLTHSIHRVWLKGIVDGHLGLGLEASTDGSLVVLVHHVDSLTLSLSLPLSLASLRWCNDWSEGVV